jgi:hypothetical protein
MRRSEYFAFRSTAGNSGHNLTAVHAEELRSHDWRAATAVTRSRWQQRRQLGYRPQRRRGTAGNVVLNGISRPNAR